MFKFSIITTCYNAEKYIKETIESVIQQTEFLNSKCELEYIIVDGDSKDNTNSIIQHYSKLCPQIKHFIEKDEGLYDGLSKGFKHVNGDVMGYLNAGDFLNKSAFSVLKKVFSNNQINWATGLKIIYNEASEIIKIQIPYNFRSNLIRCGVYGKYLPFIQQESTFWRPKLIEDLDIHYFKKLKKSGDMYLWYTFAKKYKLHIINSYLSGFKYHDNQITFRETGSTDLYLEEAKNFVDPIKIKDFFYIILDSLPWFLGRNITNIFQSLNSQFIDFISSDKEWNKKLNITKSKESIFCWVCDYSKTNGEGITANLFLEYILNKYNLKKTNIFVRNYNSNTNLEKMEKINPIKLASLNFADRYINPFIGIPYLWYKYLTGNKVAYINFLPLWNFVIFLLLPPNTILGPITGSQDYNKNIKNWEKFFRKYLMPIQFFISNIILSFRYKNLHFNTSNLKSILFEKVLKKSKFNFMHNLYLTKQEVNIDEKDIDFIFYTRFYPSKGTEQLVEFIKVLRKNYRIVTIGEKTNLDGIEEYGLISREEVLNLCEKTKYTIISSENFYSLFCFDCISRGVKVFFDENLDFDKEFLDKKQIFPITFKNINDTKLEIEKILNAFR